MNIVARNFGKLFFLALIGGLAIGAVMARRGMQVDLGTIGGVKLALAAPAVTPTSLVPAGLFPGATSPAAPNVTPVAGAANPGAGAAAGMAFARGTTGTVQKVDGKVISVAAQDGAPVKAAVNDSTVFVKTTTITAADIKVGDTVTIVGQAAADGALAAQQVTVGAATQVGALGGGALGRGAGATGAGGQAASLTTVAGSVQKVDGTILTVAQQNGQAVNVTLGPSARLQKSEQGTLADVTVGAQVTITGQAGSDGVVDAVMVQIGALR